MKIEYKKQTPLSIELQAYPKRFPVYAPPKIVWMIIYVFERV